MTKDIDFINNVNLHGYEIRDVSIQKVEAVPTDSFPKGKILYATITDPGFYYCDGSKWELITSETARKALEGRLKTVEDQLGISGGEGTSLTSRVNTLETELLGTNKKGDTDGVKYQVGVNTSDIGTLKTDVAKNKTDIKTNFDSIKEIDGKIGAVPYEGASITAAIAALQTTDSEHETKISGLETTVGDSNSGLVKDVATLKTTVGDSAKGLVKDVTDLKSTVGDSTNGLVKKVADLETGTLKTSDRVAAITGTSDTSVPSEKAVASYISTKLSGVYAFRGTAQTPEDLPAAGTNGDIYNVAFEKTFGSVTYPAGTNWVYDGGSGQWEPLSGIFDTSVFQTIDNLVKTNLSGNEADKYPSVAVVKAAVDAKADQTTTYTKTEVNGLLDDKVDKLTSHPTSAEGTTATFAKVTVNYQGQVTAGVEKITKADIEGTLDSTQIANFASDVRAASRQIIPNVTLTEEGTLVSHLLGIQYPQVAIYDGNMMVYAAVEYVGTGSVKIYGKSTNNTVTVVISA